LVDSKSQSKDTASHYSKGEKDPVIIEENKEPFGFELMENVKSKKENEDTMSNISKTKGKNFAVKMYERLKNIMKHSRVKFNPR
jgi:hypothetical protein